MCGILDEKLPLGNANFSYRQNVRFSRDSFPFLKRVQGATERLGFKKNHTKKNTLL